MEDSAAPIAREDNREAYPELGDRYRSILIDSLVIIAMMFGAGYLFEAWRSAPENARLWTGLFIFAGYEPLMTSLGCTLGQYVMKIRVRRSSDEVRRVNLLQAYSRYVIKVLLGWLIFLSIGANPRRRGIHDLGAGTVMVHVGHVPNRNKELVGLGTWICCGCASFVGYMFRRYCPPTSNMAAVSCPKLQYLVASIKTSNMFSFLMAAC